MTSRARRLVALCLCGLALAVPAAAQAPPKGELSGGYQLLYSEGESIPVGWYADVVAPVHRMIAVVGLVSGGYKSLDESETLGGLTINIEGNAAIHMFMGGVRFSAGTNADLVPFGQLLVGGVRGSASVSGTTISNGRTEMFDESQSSTEFGLLAGGGVNVRMTDTVWLRLGADFVRIFVEETSSNVFRFSTGVVFPF